MVFSGNYSGQRTLAQGPHYQGLLKTMLTSMNVKYPKTMDDSLGWPETSVPEIVECGEMEFLQKF